VKKRRRGGRGGVGGGVGGGGGVEKIDERKEWRTRRRNCIEERVTERV
jgi:hypothetical protein